MQQNQVTLFFNLTKSSSRNLRKYYRVWNKQKVLKIYEFHPNLLKLASTQWLLLIIKNKIFHHLPQPITGQYSHFIPPENTRKAKIFRVFRGYKMGTLAGNGLVTTTRYSRITLTKKWNFNDFLWKSFILFIHLYLPFSAESKYNRIYHLIWYIL